MVTAQEFFFAKAHSSYLIFLTFVPSSFFISLFISSSSINSSSFRLPPGQPHVSAPLPVGAPQRLSAQHRAEMAHVLSSLGNANRAGADLAIDKDLYDSSRHPQDSDSRRGGGNGGGGGQDAENIEFLRKIHAYNRALQQRVQEEAWNNRAAVAAVAAAPSPAKREAQKRAVEKGDQRLGQSAPPEVSSSVSNTHARDFSVAGSKNSLHAPLRHQKITKL